MRKLLPVVCLLICSPVFAAKKPPANRYMTSKDFTAFATDTQKQLNTSLKQQREALQGALDKIQQNTQSQITLLEKQIKALSVQTATAVKALNEKIAQLEGKAGKKS